jgi:hypothetical protein
LKRKIRCIVLITALAHAQRNVAMIMGEGREQVAVVWKAEVVWEAVEVWEEAAELEEVVVVLLLLQVVII